MVIVLGISIYTTRIILQALGVEDYGIYNVVCGFVAMFGFLNTSMSNGIQRYFNFELGKNGETGANKIFCTAIQIQILLSIIIIILTEGFGLWYLHEKMVIPPERFFAAEYIFQFAILSFIFTIMQAPFTASVLAHERMDFFAFVSVADAFLKLFIAITVNYLEGDHLIIYGILIFLISILNYITYFIYCKINFKEIKYHHHSFHKETFFSMLNFSGWNIFGSFSNMMRNQGINLILNLFFGPIVNAARGVATQINAGVTNFVTNILVPVRPQVIQSYAKGDTHRTLNLTYSTSKFCLFVLFIIAFPICAEINTILHLWLGDRVPDHTPAFILIILSTTFILIPMNSLATLVHASGKMRNYQVIGSTVKFLSVPAAYFALAKGWQPEWAFIMVFIFDFIGFIVGLFIIRTLMSFSVIDYIKRVFIPLIPIPFVCINMTVFMHYLIEANIIRFMVVFITTALTASLLFYTFGLSSVEKSIIREYVDKTIKKKKHAK